jgi:hypothetical protein
MKAWVSTLLDGLDITAKEITMRHRLLLAIALTLALMCLPAAAAAATVDGARWPSLAEQLARDRVPAGSALARLIVENQEIQLLRPAEAHDKMGLPPWLRVLWRKQHPEGEYLASDPTGGYPLVLKEVHEWMVEHPDLQPGTVEPDAGHAEEKAASIGPDRKVSDTGFGTRAESDIRVNYWDPSRIVSSSNNLFRGQMSMYYSSDGGASWGSTLLPLTETDSFQSDPAVEWTSDGTAWTSFIGVTTIGNDRLELRLRSFRSGDGGAHWTPDGDISADQTFADKQMMWTDHSERSPFKDHLYAIWHNGSPVFVNRRTGPDGAWADPIKVSGSETRGTGIGADIKTNSAGHVFALWPDTGSRKIYLARSLNGGATYSKPVAIAKLFNSFEIVIPAQSRRASLLYVTAGAFLNGSKSNVYAAWMDLTGIKGCNTPFDDPRENVRSTCKSRIWFSKSTNGGQKWSKPRMLNNAATLNDQFNPWMVVDETTGALSIIYYDTAGEDRTRVNLWYQSSFDEGANWSAPVRLTTASSSTADDGASDFQFGDYNSLSGIAGTFFPVWTDRRDDGLDQIWTVQIDDHKSATCKAADPFTAADRWFLDEISVAACVR